MSEYRSIDRIPQGVTLCLASASPRRRDLLTAMGHTFTVCPCETDESIPAGTEPGDATRLLAIRKAKAAAHLAGDEAIILASDTLVALGSLPLGKPKDEAHAEEMLMALSGKTHHVHTGVAVLYRGRVWAAYDSTAVTMRPFSADEARAYIATGEPMDKAGAYGIQGLGGALVADTDGAFDTVVGLPCQLVDTLLCRALDDPNGGEAV